MAEMEASTTLGAAAASGTYLWPKDCEKRPDIGRPDNI
jgi:hypothetical protein